VFCKRSKINQRGIAKETIKWQHNNQKLLFKHCLGKSSVDFRTQFMQSVQSYGLVGSHAQTILVCCIVEVECGRESLRFTVENSRFSAFEEPTDCFLLSSFCDDSNLRITIFK